MADIWNLSEKKWSEVLGTKDDPQSAAKSLMNENIWPWTETLFSYTEDSQETLDLGSGRGELSAKLALKGKNVTLLDWSIENLTFSRQLFETIGIKGKFCQADMTKPLPFENGSFDTVFSCGVFEYFTDEQIKNILKEAFRVSKKRVIIMVPNALSIVYRMGYWYMKKTKKWNWGGERPFITLKPYFKGIENIRKVEFTVAAKHSLNFLTMPTGESLKRLMMRFLKLKDHSKPAWLRQGYLLITIGEKSGIEGE